MKELTIQADNVLTGTHVYKVRVKSKTLNGRVGWDLWVEKEGGWLKKTRGNSILIAETLEDVIKQCLYCGDWCFSKTLLSIKDIAGGRQ